MKKRRLSFAGKLIKIAILLLTIGFIYLELFHRRSFPDLLVQFKAQFISGIGMLSIVLLMMPLNWGLETVKWQFLLQRFHKISFFRGCQAVMTGVSVSFFTPNRIGEFGGRILYLPPDKRITGITASIVGSISQLAVTLVYGLIGLMIFVVITPDIPYLPPAIILPASSVLLLFTLTAYFKSGILFIWLGNKKLPESLSRFLTACGTYSGKELATALMWSTLRFVVFCTQMALVMYAVVPFDPVPHWSEMCYLIPLYFFAISVVPSIGVSEVGTRGMILTQVMHDKGSEPDLLFAGTLVWLINIIIPAVIGMFAIWRVKIALKK